MKYPIHLLLLRLYTQFDLPGTSRLLRRMGVLDDARWTDAPVRTVRGKWDGCRRAVHLCNWSERLTWFLRRYYELPPQLILAEALRPGDTVVDVGANVGMITTLAARLVGPQGRVESFEANPECCRRIADVLSANAIDHVRLHCTALGDEGGRVELTVPPVHTGYGTLARVETKGEWENSRRITVDVARGDDVLAGSLDGLAAVKVDVEGFESHVIRGLQGVISAWNPLVIAETSEGLLRQAGSSAGELFNLMRGLGYSPFALDARKKRRLARAHLVLRAIRGPQELDARENNVAWLPPDGVMLERVGRFVTR